MKHSPFHATISELDARHWQSRGVFGDRAEFPLISERSFRQYRRGVSGYCGVGVTLQMCNRITNHGNMGTFSNLY